MAAKTLEEAAQKALADMQDWNELEALRESLREHMAEIHRLCSVCRQALEHLEKDARSFEDWLIMMQSARTSLRAALAEDALQQLTDEQQMIERGTKAWSDVKDATAWVDELRGNEPVTDCHKMGRDKLPLPSDHIADANKMVAPVAYVTGFSKGYAVVQPVDRSLLMPVGMALYRSPPNQSEDALGMVEPVAWRTRDATQPERQESWSYSQYEPTDCGWMVYEPLYTDPPKRKPLSFAGVKITEVRLPENMAMRLDGDVLVIERAHGIGGEE